MRIGYDVSQARAPLAGCGQHALALLRGLAQAGSDRFLLYPAFGGVDWDAAQDAPQLPEGPAFERCPTGTSPAERHRFWTRPPDDFELRLGRPDVVHAHSYFCPRGLRRARLVYTLHDLVAVDLPETQPEAGRAASFAGLHQASLRADLVIAVTEASRRRFLQTFPYYPAQRVRTIHSGSRFETRTDGGRPAPRLAGLVPGRFWLSVGAREPRKNLRGLLRAFARFTQTDAATRLVVAGPDGWLEPDLEELARSLHVAGAVDFVGYVDDDSLVWLYRNGLALLCPSLAEGFGLPVLEAMSLGTPAVVSRDPGLLEVAGPEALSVAAESDEELAEAMRRLWQAPALRLRLAEQARARAASFSWAAAARQVKDAYRESLEHEPLAGNAA